VLSLILVPCSYQVLPPHKCPKEKIGRNPDNQCKKVSKQIVENPQTHQCKKVPKQIVENPQTH
jgi:hypothetical protein